MSPSKFKSSLAISFKERMINYSYVSSLIDKSIYSSLFKTILSLKIKLLNKEKAGVFLQKNLIVIVILLGAFLLLISVPSLFPFGKQTAELTDDIDVIEIDVSGISTTIIPEKRDNVEADLDGNGTVQVREEW